MITAPDFDAIYRGDPDPFRVSTSFYERRKLAVVLACLTQARYGRVWDAACGTGELAVRLSERADAVLATDGAPEAVRLAAARCAGCTNVTVEHLVLPAAPSEDWSDLALVVLSEFVYYLAAADRRELLAVVDTVAGSGSHSDGQDEGAEVVAVHWRHDPHDAHISGAAVQDEIVADLERRGWLVVVHHDDRDFVVDVLRRESV